MWKAQVVFAGEQWGATGSDVSHVTGSDVSHVIGSDVSHRNRKKNLRMCKKKKVRRENDVISSYDVSSGHVTVVTSGYSVTSSHVTDITSGYGFTSGHMTDVTSGSTEQQPQYSQSNDEKPYYILKTNNPCFLVLGTSML